MVLLSVLVLVLGVACSWLAVALLRERREAAEVLALVDAHDEPAPAAVRRRLRETVPRTDLQAALLSREAVFEASPVPTIAFDASGSVLRANRAALRALGDRARVGGTAGAIAPALRAAVLGAAAGPPAAECEVALGEVEPRTFRVHLRSHPGTAEREVVCALVDITADVDYREARRIFSAAVSHELRTPLARILGLAETLALPMGQEERDALVAQTEIEVDNMRRLIDEMLLLAALDRGAVGEGAADAGDVAERAVEAARERPAARGRVLRVAAAPDLVVPVSAKLLEVVIGNLVDNALIHGGPQATVDVAVRGLGGEVEIIVRDDGVGIAAAHLPRVFERFYRGDASRTGAGTGLGLALVKHIVEAHGGRIGVDSAPGAGTTVRLVVPEAPAAIPSDAA